VATFGRLMAGMADIVVHKYNGSLKVRGLLRCSRTAAAQHRVLQNGAASWRHEDDCVARWAGVRCVMHQQLRVDVTFANIHGASRFIGCKFSRTAFS
jgi:hypothetical protein